MQVGDVMSSVNNFDTFFKSFFNPVCLFIERVMGEKEDEINKLIENSNLEITDEKEVEFL